MIRRIPLPVLVLAAAFSAAPVAADSLRDHALTLFSPLPSRIDSLRGQPVTPAQVALGQMLFFDPRLSDTGQFACATCHNPATGGDNNRQSAIGHVWQSGPQNAPTIFNATLNRARFWQGWAEDLRENDDPVLRTAAERTGTPDRVVAVLGSMPAYVAAFTRAFPGQSDPVSFDSFVQALEAFESTLLTPAPFDAWLQGDDTALSPQARDGLALFIDSGCATCHQGVNLGGDAYYPFRVVRTPGTEDQAESLLCFSVTEADGAEYLYRAGTLRNIALTAPYFSEGSVWSLGLAVQLMARSQLGEDLREDQTEAILAFLDSLTGTPPRLTVPILPAEQALTPPPLPPLLEE
jgi:cytochrome c peroxidase